MIGQLSSSLRASGLTQRLWSYDLYRYKDRTQAAARLPQADNYFFVSNPTIGDTQDLCFANGS
jgi:hypothetical protein